MQSNVNYLKQNDISNVPIFPKRLLLGINDGQCNMKCPFCYVHGDGAKNTKQLIGDMPYDLACKIFDEVQGTGIFISPVLWSEPLLVQNLENYVSYMSGKGLNVFINSNGLLLTEEKVTALFSAKVHTLFISIDAITNETLKTIRGIKKLQEIHDSVFRLLKIRGDNRTPRIGVSFNESEVNMHEKDKFISFWLKHVDVVRVNKIYEKKLNYIKNLQIRTKRIPCGALYDTMAINHKGNVPICCLDSHNQTNMGNVFQDSVEGVWNGEKFQEVRFYHESDQYDKISLCKNCDVWLNYLIEEREVDGIFIRQSPIMTYYNRIDRLYSWHSRIR